MSVCQTIYSYLSPIIAQDKRQDLILIFAIFMTPILVIPTHYPNTRYLDPMRTIIFSLAWNVDKLPPDLFHKNQGLGLAHALEPIR